MKFLQRIGNALSRFMYGRNGLDQLGITALWVAIGLDVVNLFFKEQQTVYLILSTVSTVVAVWVLFRLFSRNLARRRAENARFLERVVYPLRRCRDRQHKYFTCPNCRTVCRVPRGKGRIVITCPKCRGEIRGKS